jgi:hypothetical protein
VQPKREREKERRREREERGRVNGRKGKEKLSHSTLT